MSLATTGGGPLRARRENGHLIVLCLALGSILCLSRLLGCPLGALGTETQGKLLTGLKTIHAEVKEMGPYPGDDFIRREFFVGEDDDDTNKDIQVAILIQSVESKEKMTIRVTEMAREPAGSRTSVAKESRALVCLVSGEKVEIQSSDYEKDDLERLVPDILTAVRNKKRLLKQVSRLVLNLFDSERPG